MAEVAIIIGNGFDLDMGLPSKYSDFIESPEWKAVVKKVEIFLADDSYRNHSLIAQLQSASKDSLWFDIEEEIHQFVAAHTKNTTQELEEIKNEFGLIRESLAKYLKRISQNRIEEYNRLSFQLLSQLQNCPLRISEIFFNYTNPAEFMPKSMFYEHCTFTYVHGSLRNNDIVLGCDLQNGEEVNRQLSFMYKYNQLNRANHVARSILEAKEIIFFGHSLNEMDFGYFREFFKVASASPNPIRHLTIITYDENSERDIKDNMRNQGINVSDLYSNLWTFSVIHTKNVYEGGMDEIKAWQELIARLLAKDRQGI